MSSVIPQVVVIGLEESHQLPISRKTSADLSNLSESISCEEMQPKMQIQYDNPEKRENLRMIQMKGISMEPGLLKATGRCLPMFPTITVLKLQNCNLHYMDLPVIASFLSKTSVQDLFLDENPIKEMNYNCLLQIETRIQHLSLCQCDINDEGAKMLAEDLEFKDNTTQSLLTLNLTYNQITCSGAQYLANALRTNRILISLSLAGNRISDIGASAIAEVLNKFPLWHEECIDRRQRNFTRLLKRNSLVDKHLLEYKATASVPTTKDVGSRDGTPKKSRAGNKERKKGGSRDKNVTSVGRDTSNFTQVQEESQTSKVSITSSEYQRLEQLVDQEMDVDSHPYMQEVTPEDGSLWCPGNLKLAHLNLAYNRIGLMGTIAFHAAVIYQDQLLHNTRKGLLRLVLQGNPIPLTCFELTEMLEVINNRYFQFDDKINNNNEGNHKPAISTKKRSSTRKSLT